MPEGYTHIRTARHAARLAGLTLQCPQAFDNGANGPDVLYFFEVWRPAARRSVNLYALGEWMHHNSTGVFLTTLLQNARTEAQWEYALGFLCHYATDATVHPYVMLVTGKGQLYYGPSGHARFEIGLDSLLHQQDTGDALVPPDSSSPLLNGVPLYEVCTLLQPSLFAVYGADVPLDCLMESFEHMRGLRGLFATRSHLRRLAFWLAEPLAGGRGRILGHVTPARLRGVDPGESKRLPSQWVDQYAGTTRDADIFVLLNEAERASARLLTAAQEWRQGALPLAELQKIIGSNSYLTGTPTPKSTQGGTALK